MSWFAILLALAALSGSPSATVRKQCAKAAVTKHQKQQCKTVTKKKTTKKKPVAKVKPRDDEQPATPGAQRDPDAPKKDGDASPTPTPTPAPGATPVPTATPDPVKYPSRTGVDLSEWIVRPTYRTLAAGPGRVQHGEPR